MSASPFWDIAVVGAGAAGLMAGIQAGRAKSSLRIVVLDGAHRLGAKILVSGGGRCNVTHHAVDESAFAGSSPRAIRKVLLRFDVPQTVAFFEELGVALKREETGKLFPVTDSAKTVLDAILLAAGQAGVAVRHPWRVQEIEPIEGGFILRSDSESLEARRVVIATGGMSLPKSGSDGHGYAMARGLGHSTTPRIFPSLVPLLLQSDHILCSLKGVAFDGEARVVSGGGKHLQAFTGPVLLTHFGLSGPTILDVSRYFLAARMDDPEARLVLSFVPGFAPAEIDRQLKNLGGKTLLGFLRPHVPERLARALCEAADVPVDRTGSVLTREERRRLVVTLTDFPLPITGDRGYRYAEVTAGGVPLSEVRLETMESRIRPGLYLCGEICDVDGRIGGFNFQWAWASGYVAGVSAAKGGG